MQRIYNVEAQWSSSLQPVGLEQPEEKWFAKKHNTPPSLRIETDRESNTVNIKLRVPTNIHFVRYDNQQFYSLLNGTGFFERLPYGHTGASVLRV